VYAEMNNCPKRCGTDAAVGGFMPLFWGTVVGGVIMQGTIMFGQSWQVGVIALHK
jgi:tetrahydromethanopterin S-methyltransferase subunit B